MPTESALEARLNVSADGKRFRCEFIREGPVDYSDNGLGIECLRRATIERHLQSFIGKPLTLEHIDPRLNVGDPAIFAQYAHGVVDKVGQDADGWFYCEGEITTEQARREAPSRNPSCGYLVKMTGPGGRWNNVPFKRELTEIEFHHLALCSGRSRYEESEFRLNATTEDQGKTMKFKLLRTIVAAVAGGKATTEEVELSGDTVLKLPTGGEIRLNDAVEAYAEDEKEKAEEAEAEKKKKEAEEAGRENAITDETEVMVGDKKVKVAVLREAYTSRQNAAQVEKDRAAEEARLNAEAGKRDFAKIQAAGNGQPIVRKDFPQTAGSLDESLKRGKY